MRKVIYTAILGGYEDLKPTIYPNEGWDHICFSDTLPTGSHNGWDVFRMIEMNPRRLARRIKSLPHKYLPPDTTQSIWIDGSFQINCIFDDFWKKNFKKDFSAAKHPQRDCVYDEVEQIIAAQRGGAERILEQIESYKGIVPSGNGLIASGILLRRHSDTCIKLCEDWFNETSRWSLRDQVSFAKVSMNHEFSTFKYRYISETDFVYTPHGVVINEHGTNFI